MMTVRSFAIIACASVLAIFLGQMACAQETIKVGELNSYKSQTAFLDPYKKGWEMAVDEINAKGGVLGKKLEVISRDDGSNPGEAVRVADELVTREGVNILAGTFLSNIGLAVTEFAGKKQVFFLAAEPLTDKITWQNGNKYTFRLRPQTYMQTAMLLPDALAAKKKRWALVYPNYEYGQAAAAAFKEMMKAKQPDVEFVTEQAPPLGKVDAGAVVQAIDDAKPDGIFIFYPGAHGVQFVKQWAQSGLNKTVPLYQVFSIDAITLPQQGDLALGTLGAQEWVNDQPNEQNKRYVADFKKKHGVYPSYYGAQSYDAIMLVASAAEALKGDLSNKDKVRAELKKANFKSLRGDFKYNTNNFPIENFYIQETVKDPQGMMTVKTIATAVKDAKDSYYEKCPMK